MGQTKTSALKEVRAFKKILSKKMKIEQMILYGSRARGDYLKQSDVDVIVRFGSKATLFDFIGLGNHLEEKMKIKVDIVSEGGIRPELRGNIVKDVVRI